LVDQHPRALSQRKGTPGHDVCGLLMNRPACMQGGVRQRNSKLAPPDSGALSYSFVEQTFNVEPPREHR
jgi:hypothetical protein